MVEATQASEAEEVRLAARQSDRDRYLAALLAPRAARAGLLALAAFHGEIARIPASVREPGIGAIRLQWWRDALAAQEPSGSPVADTLRRAIGASDTALAAAMSIIDAYEMLFVPDELAPPEAVTSFAAASQGTAFRLAAAMLGAAAGEDKALILAAGQCYGRVQLLRALPALLSRGHDPFGPRPATDDWATRTRPLLAEARASLVEVRRLAPLAPATIRGAILPVALVEPYLTALEGLGSRIAVEQATISPLTRVWRIYAAKRRGRF